MPVYFSRGLIADDGTILNAPAADGTSGQALTTDGSGALSFASVGSDITGATASAPSPAADGDSDTGLFSDTADTLSLAAGGVEALRIEEVAGEATIIGDLASAGTTTPVMSIENSSTGDAYLRFTAGTKSFSIGINNVGGTDAQFYITSGDGMDADRVVLIQSDGSFSFFGAVGPQTEAIMFPRQTGGITNGCLAVGTSGADGFIIDSVVNANDDVTYTLKGRTVSADRIVYESRVVSAEARFAMFGETPAAQQAHIADVPTAGSATAADNATAINSLIAVLETFGWTATS